MGARKKARAARGSLSREAVLLAASELADREGIDRLSMRRLGQALGVEAMSLYKHVANKDEILDGIVDHVVREIDLPDRGEPWRPAMRRRAVSAFEMFGRHPWALGLMESRKNPGPHSLRYYDAVLRCLREDGFSVALAAHAFSLLDSYVYGFALQHSKLPFETEEELAAIATHILAGMPEEEYPHLHESTREHVLQPGCSYDAEFAWGLELVLDALERRVREASPRS